MSGEDDKRKTANPASSRHLIRAGEARSETLGQLTGLSRMRFAAHDLEAAEVRDLAEGRERFLYVLEGIGEVTAASATQTAAAGDMVALGANEAARVVAGPSGLKFLLGAGPRDSSAD
ncbi:MAG: hypothetical protein AAGE43_02095 [Pseudomonadota bacterium]